MQTATIEQCRAGALDAAVCSVQSAKNGCNLQGMNWMVSLGWIGRYMDEVQCKGNMPLMTILIPTGRVCRIGQKNKTRFRVLWVEGDAHDEAPKLANKSRMTEAQALTTIDRKRLHRKNVSNRIVEILD